MDQVRTRSPTSRDGEIAYRSRGLTRTGPDQQISIRLLRDDYNVADLPLFDEDSGLLEITQEKTGSTSLAPSQLIVKYIDQTDGAQRQVIVNNNAVAASQGGGRPRKSSSWACRSASWPGESAWKCVEDHRPGSAYKGDFDRRARSLNPGQAVPHPFDPARGIPGNRRPGRRIEDNFLGDGKITLTVVQDQSTRWRLPAWHHRHQVDPPDLDAWQLPARRLIEAPLSRTGRRDRSGESPAPGRPSVSCRLGRGADEPTVVLIRRYFSWRL